jgi:hypothetical protein
LPPKSIASPASTPVAAVERENAIRPIKKSSTRFGNGRIQQTVGKSAFHSVGLIDNIEKE